MATWTTVPDASLEPGKPIRSIDALALRDNPVAIAEGASGAPKVRTAALQPPAAGDGFLICRLQESSINTLQTAYSSTVNQYRYFDADTQISFAVLVPGSIRLKFEHAVLASGATSYVRALKNGTQIYETTTTLTALQSKSVDISVSTGDAITLQQRTSDASTGVRWTNIRVYSATPDMAVA